jgi:hypothetical protein
MWTETCRIAEYDVLGVSQACAGVISTNSDASAFWLDDAQQAVLANEHGSDASPLFMGGARPTRPCTCPGRTVLYNMAAC